jgi:hypothetical protein
MFERKKSRPDYQLEVKNTENAFLKQFLAFGGF